jgi:Cu/Zn superoxide dismutase
MTVRRSNTHRTPGNGGVASAWRMVARATAAALLLSGCSGVRLNAPVMPLQAEEKPNPAAGQVAPLRAIGGSAVSGKVRVIERGDGATVLVSVVNFPSGAYRIAFHETPNCSSPNGFSAGPAWAPSSAGKPPQDLIPTQYTNSESRAETELRVASLRSTGPNGVAGRSVVLYAGSAVTQPRPDVPNAAIACGIFEPVRPLAF